MSVEKIESVQDIHYLLDNQHQLLCRGHANASWTTMPSSMRQGWDLDFCQAFEIALLEPILTGAGIPFVQSFDPVENLAVFQHYSIPTRLLDLTLNPLVALFFACYDPHGHNDNADGKLFIVETSHLPPLPSDEAYQGQFGAPMNAENRDLYMMRLLHHDTFKYFVPHFKNPRLRAQRGCFIFFDYTPLAAGGNPFVSLEDFVNARNAGLSTTSPNFLFHLSKLVDGKSKKRILQELKTDYRISEETLLLQEDIHTPELLYIQDLRERALARAKNLVTGRVK